MIDREVIFHPHALDVIRGFPPETRKAVGKVIRELQLGKTLTMPLSRSLANIALGVSEIRIREAEGAYRIFYYVKNSKGILIFHAFAKKSQKPPRKEIELARKRLKEMLNEIR